MTAAPVEALLCCERFPSGGGGLPLLLPVLFPSVSRTASQGSPAEGPGAVSAEPPAAGDASSLSALRFVSGSRSSQSKRLMLEDSAPTAAAGCCGGGFGAREAAAA